MSLVRRGKTTKKADVEDEEEEEEDAEEAKAEKPAPKAKGGRSAKGGKKKGATAVVKKGPTDKFVRGQWNPDVKLVDKSEVLEGTGDVVDYESVRMNNKNLIRAVYTKNYDLLEKVLSKERFLSGLFERWGVDNNFNAIELAFKNNDKKAIQMILAAAKDEKRRNAPIRRSGLSAFNTGSNNAYAYGAFTRRVQMGRGGKELNAALLKDEGYSSPFDWFTIPRIIASVTDTDLLDHLIAFDQNVEAQVYNSLETAVTSGNLKATIFIASKLFKRTGHGVNKLHVEVLTLDDPKDLSDFRAPSVTAKVINSSITPLHFASINPNAKMLEALLEKVPEYSIADFFMRKPIHYAAACEGPEPLKLLISKSVDFREGDRGRMTPLMIACKLGREHNVEVLLSHDDGSLLPAKTRDNKTAFHFAVENGHLGCMKLLHQHGADVNTVGQ